MFTQIITILIAFYPCEETQISGFVENKLKYLETKVWRTKFCALKIKQRDGSLHKLNTLIEADIHRLESTKQYKVSILIFNFSRFVLWNT